jgi:hypothetical protein
MISKTEQIRALNDDLRQNLTIGTALITARQCRQSLIIRRRRKLTKKARIGAKRLRKAAKSKTSAIRGACLIMKHSIWRASNGDSKLSNKSLSVMRRYLIPCTSFMVRKRATGSKHDRC